MSDLRRSRPRNRKKLTACESWYDAELDRHRRLALKIQTLLEELLSAAQIQIHRVDSRVKTRSSYLEKANKKKYSKPTQQITDVVGLRVTTYLDSTVRQVCEIIDREFEIDREQSPDKDLDLGADRVGYRSKHFVARLKGERSRLPECIDFGGRWFEIQVRSLLQHAWAEIEHDRRFKYQGELPGELRRRFSLVAAQLESADREFNELAREIDRRAAATVRDARGAQADLPLTIVEAAAYLNGLFGPLIESGLVEPGLGGTGGSELIAELGTFGIRTLGQLADLVPSDFTSRFPEEFEEQTTFFGIVRDAMMLADADRYFRDAYRNKWQAMDQASIDMLKKNGVDIVPLLQRFRIDIYDSREDQDVDLDDLAQCAFCNAWFYAESLQPVGAGGSDAPRACDRCVVGR